MEAWPSPADRYRELLLTVTSQLYTEALGSLSDPDVQERKKKEELEGCLKVGHLRLSEFEDRVVPLCVPRCCGRFTLSKIPKFHHLVTGSDVLAISAEGWLNLGKEPDEIETTVHSFDDEI